MFNSSKALKNYQWQIIANLYDRNYSVKESLEMLYKIYPDDENVKRIITGLSQGQSLKNIIGYSNFEKRLCFILDYLPLGESIKVVTVQKNKQSALKKKITEKMGYQLLLVICAIGILFLFSNYVLPNMMYSMDMSTEKGNNLIKVFFGLNIFKDVIIILFILCAAGFLLIKVTNSEKYVWMFLHQHNKDKWIKTFVTYEFVIQLEDLLDAGINFRDALEIIRYQNDKSLTKLLAFHFDETLLKGTDFETSLKMTYFDNEFYSLCVWGIRNEDFSQSLKDYHTMVEIKFERALRLFFMIIQTACYLFIAIVIILAYQVLLLPLEMLESI